MCVISVCGPEFYLPFNGGRAVDMSGNKYYVGEELSYYGNGVAIFTGNDRLIVPRFTNIETKTLVIKVTYTSAPSSSARAIVSNSDCGNEPSIIIYEDNRNIHFGVGTSESQMVYTSVPRLVSLFACCFASKVNSYGHGGTVSSPKHTFSWASLNKQ